MATQIQMVEDKFFNMGYMQKDEQRIGTYWKIKKESKYVRIFYLGNDLIMKHDIAGTLICYKGYISIEVRNFITNNYKKLYGDKMYEIYARKAYIANLYKEGDSFKICNDINNDELSNILGGTYENVASSIHREA